MLWLIDLFGASSPVCGLLKLCRLPHESAHVNQRDASMESTRTSEKMTRAVRWVNCRGVAAMYCEATVWSSWVWSRWSCSCRDHILYCPYCVGYGWRDTVGWFLLLQYSSFYFQRQPMLSFACVLQGQDDIICIGWPYVLFWKKNGPGFLNHKCNVCVWFSFCYSHH